MCIRDSAKEKLLKKNCDMIIANNLKVEGAGFQTNTNVATIIEKDTIQTLDKMSKYDLGKTILHRILNIMKEKKGEPTC